VNWTAPSTATPYDTIALSATDAPDWWSISLHDTGGAASGSFELDSLLPPGRYELRYITIDPTGNGTVTARCTPLVIGLSGFKLTASPAGVISAGGAVRVDWTAASGSTGQDTIGLFKAGSSNDQPISLSYTSGAPTGNFSVGPPTNPGLYEFRYMFGTADGSGFLEAATSNVITVQ
jgi:hypothetical protein